MGEIEGIFWRKPEGIKRCYVDGRFGQIHYRQAGATAFAKMPLVMLHQSPSSGRAFEGLLSILGSDRLVLSVDTPGFGDSDPPSMVPTIADYSAAFIDFFDSLNLPIVDLFGDHTGAKIAVEIARQAPSRVGRLIFNSCPIYSREQMARMMVHLEEEKPKDEVPADGNHIVNRWKALQKWYGSAPLALVDRDFAEMQRPLDLGWYGHNAAFAVNHADNLPHVVHPILVLCPNDMLWDATKSAASYLRNGHILELPDYGMGSLSLNNDVFAEIFCNFLDNSEGRSSDFPAPVPPPASHSVTGRLVKRRFVDTPSGQVHLRIAGDEQKSKRPVLCLHMSPVSSRNFEALLEQFCQDRCAVAIDIPGFGESDAPYSEPTISDLADSVISAMLSLDLSNPFDLVGDHTGAVIAIHLAVSRPELVHSLALNTIPCFSEEERKERLRHSNYIGPQRDGAHLLERWNRINTIIGPGITQKIINRNFVESLRGGPFGHWGHRAVFSYSLGDVLPKVVQPTLVFRPRDGLETRTQEAFSLLKLGTMHDLPDEKYGFMEIRAREIANTLREFFDT